MKKVAINKKAVIAALASTMLALTLTACGGNRDTTPEPTPPNNPPIEQPNNDNNEQNNEVSGFDPANVSIVSIDAVSNSFDDNLDLIKEWMPKLDETMKQAIEAGAIDGSANFNEGLNINTIRLLMNDPELGVELSDYTVASEMAIAEFAINGNLSGAWTAFFATEEMKEAFMDIVKVIEHAVENNDNTHVMRLLEEAAEHPDKNNFTNLQATILIAHLHVRGTTPEQTIAEQKNTEIRSFYSSNRSR